MIAEIRLLEEVFTKGDKTYTQVNRTELGYMYEVTDSYLDHTYYEVFKKRVANDYDFDTKTTLDTEHEVYPANEAFGNWAWCISRGEDNSVAYDVAFAKLNSIKPTN